MLPPHLQQQIQQADLLIGGTRHLSYFPNFVGERLAITSNIEQVVTRLQQAQQSGQTAIVLASGDPLCYGMGATLRRYFPAEALTIIPAPTAYQLAFSALGEPWHDATLLSAHARPLPTVVESVRRSHKAAILTDQQHTPRTIAQALLTIGLSPSTRGAVCQDLGSPLEQIVRADLAQIAQSDYAPLNVLIVWPDPSLTYSRRKLPDPSLTYSRKRLPEPVEGIAPPANSEYDNWSMASPVSPGLPDEAFSTSAQQLTKREVRLLSLAELALQPNEVLWDIGAGCGSVAIEAGRAQPMAQVYAIEKRAGLIEHLQKNLRRYPTPNLHWQHGHAPADMADWPDPNAIFIGGSGGQLAELITLAKARLVEHGRLVINLVTLENLHLVRQHLPNAHINQVQISRAKPIMQAVRFSALNPVFIVSWRNNL